MSRQKAQPAFRLSDISLGAVFDKAAFGIAVLGRDAEVLDANGVFQDIYVETAGTLLSGHEAEFSELIRGERDLLDFEQQTKSAGGQTIWTECTISRLRDASQPHLAICILRDLTALRQNERRVLHEMTHDPLTGLPNRLLFESRLREELAQMRDSGLSFALLMVDLDHFREINEGFGHDVGDFVVSEVGRRLRAGVGARDEVARIGMDQFAILAGSLKDVRHVETTARKLFNAFAKPMAIGSRQVYVSASVGIVLASPSYERSEDLMRDAQVATRYAKSSGGSRTAIFDAEMHARAQKRLQLTSDLRAGLERGEFFLVYQPIVRLDDGAFTGCEALLRWQHPKQGLLLPADFIPLAEQIGLSTQMGRAVLRLACRRLASWRDERGVAIRMNINVAWPDLLEIEFEQSLIAVTREFEIDPAQVTLEITESIELNPGGRATLPIDRLRQRGFAICIDDFGTGYSSLHYLQRFPIDAMKIDRSFVSGTQSGVASEPIVRALITLAEGFGVRVVAEGVETEEQSKALLKAGCRFGQGYYFAKPLTAEELEHQYPTAFGRVGRPGARQA